MALRKRKIKIKTSAKNIFLARSKMTRRELGCLFCNTPVMVDTTVASVLCGGCVARLAGSPQAIGKYPKPVGVVKAKKEKRVKKVQVVKATAGWGRGWHLKKAFKAPDGKVYSFGKPVKGKVK